jgi:serine/threonine-protein kinase
MDNPPDRTIVPPAADSTPADLTGRTFGDFQVLRRLGQGGMGEVYLAEQVSLRRKVALKLLKPELASNPVSLARFKKEAEAIAQATHANIVQIYFIGEADGVPYMALEYVEGRSLRELLEKKGPPPLPLALNIMWQVAEALKRACDLGIVHRDIKPENILLTDRDTVKVADFGLSRLGEATAATLRLTQSGDALGTPLYMSPEQVEGRPVDHRTDIYSLGVTCYHMLAGEPPFGGATPYEVAFKHVQEEAKPLAAVRPDLPPGVCVIVHKMMAKDPADRFQTAAELLDEIARILQGEVPRARLSRRSRRLVWAFAASVLLSAAAGAGYAWYKQRAAAQAPPGPTLGPASLSDADVERVLPSQRREQALRDAVEEYLNPQNKKAEEVDTGCRLCRDLGLSYLEHGRLDDAGKLFDRLEKFANAPPYNSLGKLGTAIVLALEDKSEESNARFVALVKGQPFQRVVTLWIEDAKVPGGKPAALPPALQMWAPPALRYWVVQALRYNQKNGLPDAKVPELLLKLRQKTPPV